MSVSLLHLAFCCVDERRCFSFKKKSFINSKDILLKHVHNIFAHCIDLFLIINKKKLDINQTKREGKKVGTIDTSRKLFVILLIFKRV